MTPIAPLSSPYAPELQATFDRLMPPGFEPLTLFRTLAQSSRVFNRFLAGSLLDEGPLPLRQREIIILRTCALNRCEYEWGVHVAVFGGRAAFGPVHVDASLTGNRSPWSEAEAALVAACEDLHQHTGLSDATWALLRPHFDDAQILEVISLVGFYRTVSLQANSLRLAPEPFAPRFPADFL